MPNIKRANTSGITKSGVAINDVPDAPTIGSATDGGTGTTALVSFTPALTGGTPSSYTVTSTPGSITSTGSSSPLTVSGLTTGTSYTFKVKAANSAGIFSPESSASNSVTPLFPLIGSYDSLDMVTVGAGGVASIVFTGIPQEYTDLQLRYSVQDNRGTFNDSQLLVRINSDSASSYAIHYVRGNGAATEAVGSSSQTGWNNLVTTASLASNNFASGVMDILDYANNNKNKTMRLLTGFDNNNSGTGSVGLIYLYSGLWMNPNPITSITISSNLGSALNQYTSFALYGVK
jgi:hypothetical protein